MSKLSIITILLVSMIIQRTFAFDEVTLKKEYLSYVTPPITNARFFGFEFGYTVNKKIEAINYSYNAFVEALLYEETYSTHPALRAGAIGGKGGVILPTQPWIPLSLTLAAGYAKSALHKDPWFGKRELSHSLKDLLLIEGGFLYHYNSRLLFRWSYQLVNVDYFDRKQFLSFGMNF